jgi:hypothetical protein
LALERHHARLGGRYEVVEIPYLDCPRELRHAGELCGLEGREMRWGLLLLLLLLILEAALESAACVWEMSEMCEAR